MSGGLQGHLFAPATQAALQDALTYPVARKADPETSHEAANAVTSSGTREGQCAAALALVRKYPGRTSLELAGLSGMCRFVLARRLPELEQSGLVRKTGARCSMGTNRPSSTWEAW